MNRAIKDPLGIRLSVVLVAVVSGLCDLVLTAADDRPVDPKVLAALTLRKQELQRRVAALPAELGSWLTRVNDEPEMKAHFTQLRDLKDLMDRFLPNQQTILAAMNPQGDRGQVLDQVFALEKELARAQGVWNYYREKFQQRMSSPFKESLRVADIVAWDCYQPVLKDAVRLEIITDGKRRSPPLCYYTVDYSGTLPPLTLVRGDYPYDLKDREGGTLQTPIPVIALPWDHAQNLWEFLSIPHEVGHDLEADLNLHDDLIRTVVGALVATKKVPQERIDAWRVWTPEAFADLVALQRVGPAFAEALMNVLMQPAQRVIVLDIIMDCHPTPYLRILMNTAYARTLIEVQTPADGAQRKLVEERTRVLELVWKDLYGDPPGLNPYLDDFPIVFRALMDTPMPSLRNHTVRELMPYSAGDNARIEAAARDLANGDFPGALLPRYGIAAARLAVDRMRGEVAEMAAKLKTINELTAKLIEENSPKDLLGPGGNHSVNPSRALALSAADG